MDKDGKEQANIGAKRGKRGLFVAGNPGRPKGSQDRRTAPFRAQIDKALPEILTTLVEQAKAGDTGAAKILIDRSLPAVKPVEVARVLPIAGSTLTEKAAGVIDAVAGGAVSVDEATRLLQALGSVARIVEVDDLIKRVEALESVEVE